MSVDGVRNSKIEIESQETMPEYEECYCDHENLTTDDVMQKPNRGCAICPECGLIVKVVVEAYTKGDKIYYCDNPKCIGGCSCKASTPEPKMQECWCRYDSECSNCKPKPIEKLDEDVLLLSFENMRSKINQLVDAINELRREDEIQI